MSEEFVQKAILTPDYVERMMPEVRFEAAAYKSSEARGMCYGSAMMAEESAFPDLDSGMDMASELRVDRPVEKMMMSKAMDCEYASF